MRHPSRCILSCFLSLAAIGAPRLALAQESEPLSRWADRLAHADVPTALEAERVLLWAGPSALPPLRTLFAEWEDSHARVVRLVADLDDDAYDCRDRAQRELEAIGIDAEPELVAATLSALPEVSQRASAILETIRAHPTAGRPWIRSVARLLAIHGEAADAPRFKSLLSCADAEARQYAVRGLLGLGGRECRSALEEALHSSDREIRWTAGAALIEVEGRLPPSPDRFFEDWPGEQTRLAIYRALYAVESRDGVDFAARAYAREDSTRAKDAIESLLQGFLDPACVADAVLGLLAQAPGDRKPRLVRTLTEPSQRVWKALSDGLTDSVPKVRASCVEQLARLFPGKCRSSVEGLLHDPDPAVRAGVLWALHCIVGAETTPFSASLAETDEDVLEAALTALASRTSDEDVRGRVSEEPEFCRVRILCSHAAPAPPAREEILNRRLRSLSQAPPEDRRSAIREGLSDRSDEVRKLALSVCIVLGVDGLEDDLLPLLGCGDAESEWLASLCLPDRAADGCRDRVRALAKGERPGRACDLWMRWEGRPAVEQVLKDARDSKKGREARLRALAEVELQPEDAGTLLSISDAMGTRGRMSWLSCLAQTRSDSRWTSIQRAVDASDTTDLLPHALALLLAEPSYRAVALRLCAVLVHPHGIVETLAAAPAPDAAALLLRWLDEDGSDYDPYCLALVRCAPAAAREVASSRSHSLHAKKRLQALRLCLLLGDAPSAELFEAFRPVAGGCVLGVLQCLMDLGRPDALGPVPALLEDPDPWVQRWAWRALASGTAHLPEGARYGRCLPAQARAAWTEWLRTHREASRESLLDAALTERSLPTSPEGWGRVLIEGPWQVEVAVEHAALRALPGERGFGWSLPRVLGEIVRRRRLEGK